MRELRSISHFESVEQDSIAPSFPITMNNAARDATIAFGFLILFALILCVVLTYISEKYDE